MFLILIIGIMQVQSMAELAIRISDKDLPVVMENKVKLIHRAGNFVNTLATCFMIALSIWFMFVLHTFYSGCESTTAGLYCCGVNKFLQYMAVLGWVSGIFYSILTIALILSFMRLQKSFKATFALDVVA